MQDFLDWRPEGDRLSDMNERMAPSKESLEDRLMNPPTSSDLRETVTPAIAEKFGQERDYLEPRGEGEKIGGELTQDLISFFMPGTGQLRMAVRIGAPIAGNLAKQGAKYLGADEKEAEQAKLGVMLMTTVAGQSNPAQFAQQRIAQARNLVPDTATANAVPLANSLMPLYHRIQRGLGVPSKTRAAQGMRDLAGQVQNGRISMRSLMDARNDVNEWIAEAGGFDVPAAVRDRTIANLNDLKRQIIDTVDTNLTQRFPQAAELYESGYEAAAVTHQSNAISNFIERYFGRKVASAGAKVLFPGLAGGAAVLPKTAATAASVYPLYKTGQVLYRVGNSPTLARYYGDVLRNASQANAPAMIKSIDMLDKQLEKDEKKEQIKEQKQNKGKKPTIDEFKSRFKNMD